jgi:hypothetical protein
MNELLHSADAASICGGREVFRAARSQVESAALAPSSIGETGQTIRAGWIEEDGECMSGAGAWGLLTWGLSRGVLFWAVSGGERGGEPDGLLRCIAAFGDEGHLLDTVDTRSITAASTVMGSDVQTGVALRTVQMRPAGAGEHAV